MCFLVVVPQSAGHTCHQGPEKGQWITDSVTPGHQRASPHPSWGDRGQGTAGGLRFTRRSASSLAVSQSAPRTTQGSTASKPSASGTTSFLSFFPHFFCTKNISHEIYALKFLSLELVRLAYPKFYSLFPSPPSPWQAPFHSLILRIYFRCLQ